MFNSADIVDTFSLLTSSPISDVIMRSLLQHIVPSCIGSSYPTNWCGYCSPNGYGSYIDDANADDGNQKETPCYSATQHNRCVSLVCCSIMAADVQQGKRAGEPGSCAASARYRYLWMAFKGERDSEVWLQMRQCNNSFFTNSSRFSRPICPARDECFRAP